MDLITLDSNYQPAKLIENYDSLIWTERYNTMGDFQILTGNVDTFMTLLPEGTVLSLRESNVPMIVETHNVIRKKNQPTALKIVGREFSSILDRRQALGSLAAGATDWNVTDPNIKQPSDAAFYAINRICVAGILDANDIFPSAQVQFTSTDYGASTGPTRMYSIPKGNLLDAVLQLLQTEAKADATTVPATPAVVQHGLRAVRPNSSGTAIAIQIYVGTDKTASVYFDATRDLLDDGNYLFSKKGSATTAYVLAPNGGTSLKLEIGATSPSGLNRRVILVDASGSGIVDPNALQAHGQTSLSEAPVTALYDGSINQDLSPYKYGVDYNLGDVVKLVGDYNLSANARVTEYIRSEDKTGNKSYPTLTTITP